MSVEVFPGWRFLRRPLEDLDVPDATVAASPDAGFGRADLTTFCRLDELGLVKVTGQRLESDRAVLACRVVEPDGSDARWCRRCGCEGSVRDTVIRRLAHEPFPNLTNYIGRSLLETGGFRPRLHPEL